MPDNQSPAAKRERDKANRWRVPLIALLIILSPLLLTIVAVYLVGIACQWLALRLLIVVFWAPRARRALIVYSESPHWRDYFERDLLPRVRADVAVLNWSKRKEWKTGLAVWVFRFYGGSVAFNPLVILVRPFGRMRVIRLWEAFRNARHGRSDELDRLKATVLTELGAA